MRLLSPGVEMTARPDMTGRVRRQAAVSAVALGVIWALAASEPRAAAPVAVALAAGWVLMPLLLAASVRRPRLRYGLALPAGLVSGGLAALCLTALPEDAAGALGWWLVTAGVLTGGGLGTWFWYRLLPVPAALDRPLAPGRWALIGGHVALVVVGLALVGWARI